MDRSQRLLVSVHLTAEIRIKSTCQKPFVPEKKPQNGLTRLGLLAPSGPPATRRRLEVAPPLQ